MYVLPAYKHDIRKNHNQNYPTATEKPQSVPLNLL